MATGYSPQQIAAIAKAQVQSALAPQLNDLQGQQINQNIQTAQQGLNAQAAYNALADLMAKLPDQINATYTNAADRQAAYGKGFSNQFTQNTQAVADQANALLEQNNSPAHVQAPTGQADVLYALGGYNPASALNQAGAAFKTAAEQQPIGARQQGVAAFQAALAKQAQDAAAYQANRAKILAQSPSLEQSAINAIQSHLDSLAKINASTSKVNPTLSAAAGYMVNDQGQVLPGKDGKPQPYTPYVKPGGGQIVKGADGYYRVNPDGSVTALGIKPPAGSRAGGASTHLQSKNVNGHYVTFDPTTGTYYIPGTNTPVDPNSFSKPAKVSAAAMSKARSYLSSASQGYYASATDSSTPLSTSQLRSIAKDSKMTLGALLAITDPNELAKLGLGYVQVGQHDDPKIQQLYVTLVKKYGVPARQAFNMVASTYSQWGQSHRAAYFPKDSAAQGAAFSSGSASQRAIAVTNLAREALGTPYVWGGSKPGGFDCSGLLYYVWGRVGVQIPRTTFDQWSAGKPVGRGQLQPGDAVFFKGSDSIVRGGKVLPGHVGMYLGGGKIIEAPYTGTDVQVTSLAGHGDYMGARRFA